MHLRYLMLTGILILVVLVIGCSKSGGSPVTPEPNIQDTASYSKTNEICLGLYDIEFNPGTQVFTVIPLRGVQFQLNLVNLLQPPAGDPANFTLTLHPDGCDLPNGLLDLDINITHPFPISDFRTFDLRLIFMGDKGTSLSSFDYGIQFPKPTETRLVNADGYSRWWNATEFLTPNLFGYSKPWFANGNPKSTLNGFKYYTDELGPGDPFEIDVANRGTWSTETPGGNPNTVSREHIIQFEMMGDTPIWKFSYAIVTSFELPEPGYPSPAPIDAFTMAANSPEAYKIGVEMDPSSTAYFTSTQTGGDLVLNLDIFDWQALENPGGVPAEIDDFIIESPTMWSGPLNVFDIGTIIGSTNETSSTWQIEIPDVVPEGMFQDILITVESADPDSYAPIFPGAGIYPGGATLAAYNLVTLELPGNSPPIIGEISGPPMYPDGVQLLYALSSMVDLQDGPNLTVDWDFDGDGLFLDDQDGSNTNMTGTYTFTGSDTHYVQCRVTDTALEYTDSNILTVEPITLPYVDPMDIATSGLWTVMNGLFDTHNPFPALEWNVQTDHWSTSDISSGIYLNYMDTTLVSPVIPAGDLDGLMLVITHRWDTELYDTCQVIFRINGGSWITVSPQLYYRNDNYPNYDTEYYNLTGLTPGDSIEVGFHFNSDSSINDYSGWDITEVLLVDNQPPEITGIFGPDTVGLLGPWTYTVAATDLDGFSAVNWSIEESGMPQVYDDPGDPLNDGLVELYFPADGIFEVWVEVTDAANPPLSSTFGYLEVEVAATNPDAFFFDHFNLDTGVWQFTGGLDDGAYQDFWHVDTVVGMMANAGEDGCYAEELTQPTEKTASADIIFPSGGGEIRMKMIHELGTELSGTSVPYDGQWVTLDGGLIEPSYGFLYTNDGWDHGYFVGYTYAYLSSTFYLGNSYSDGQPHTLTFHSLSSDALSNCGIGWRIDYLEIWEVE